MARQLDSIDVTAKTTPEPFNIAPVLRQRGNFAEAVIYVANPSAEDVAIPEGGTGRVSLVKEDETEHSALYIDPGESRGFGGYTWTAEQAPVRLLCEDGDRVCRVTILIEGSP